MKIPNSADLELAAYQTGHVVLVAEWLGTQAQAQADREQVRKIQADLERETGIRQA